MSNVLAIAAVTDALVNLLGANIDAAQVNNAGVTNYTPDQLDKLTGPGINVFLYQVTPNTAYRNADLATRTADGHVLRRPQLALDLHYLLTFYGDDSLLEQQRLLGSAALTLHASPTLPRSQIQPVQIGPGVGSVAPSELDTQAELIRFTPVAFTLEELSKLWSFLFKIDYVLSTAYLASVVLIEADVPILAPAKRVLRADLTIGPFRQPVITQVAAAAGAAAPITAQSAIVLTGINLTANAGAITQVVIGGVAQTVIPAVPTQITLTLPAGLPAGPQTAQVVQPLLLGNPAVVHPGTGSTSGIAAFVLQPVVAQTGSPGSYEISVQPAAASPPGLDLVATLVPEVLAGQEVVLQLLPQAPAAQPLLFDGGQLAADSSTVSVSIGTPPPGTYIAQLLIDGAPTPMVYNVSGVPIAPSVTI